MFCTPALPCHIFTSPPRPPPFLRGGRKMCALRALFLSSLPTAEHQMTRVTDQYEFARQHLAGGVSASTRLNRALGHPLYFDRAAGCRVWDLDGNEYIDLCCSHGATLLGHGDARLRAAVERVLDRGAACSYENELHGQFA